MRRRSGSSRSSWSRRSVDTLDAHASTRVASAWRAARAGVHHAAAGSASLRFFPATLLLMSGAAPLRTRTAARDGSPAGRFVGALPFLAAAGAALACPAQPRGSSRSSATGATWICSHSRWADTLWSSWHGFFSWTPVAYLAFVAMFFYAVRHRRLGVAHDAHRPGDGLGQWLDGRLGGRVVLRRTTVYQRPRCSGARPRADAFGIDQAADDCAGARRCGRDDMESAPLTRQYQRGSAGLRCLGQLRADCATASGVRNGSAVHLPVRVSGQRLVCVANRAAASIDTICSGPSRCARHSISRCQAMRVVICTHGWGAHVSDPFGELRWIDGDGAELALAVRYSARSEPPRGDGRRARAVSSRPSRPPSRWSSTAARPFVLRRIQSNRRSSNSPCRREALCSFPVSIGLPSSVAREQRPLRCTASRSSEGRWGRWAPPAPPAPPAHLLERAHRFQRCRLQRADADLVVERRHRRR